MRTIEARTGAHFPVLGQGTWHMGEKAARKKDEVRALQLGFDLGLTLVDTAESYASGGAEKVVGEAIHGRRDEIYLVSKVSPQNASRKGIIRAAERSLKRLGTDRLDLYLLHWPGNHPLDETFEAFQELVDAGKIMDYGVSNFDLEAMKEAQELSGGDRVTADQVLYNLERRNIEPGLLPWCAERQIVVMAYSPLERGQLGDQPGLREVAERHGLSPEQIALAWTVHHRGVVAVVKASEEQHVRANAASVEIELTREDLAELNQAFPAPVHDVPLDIY